MAVVTGVFLAENAEEVNGQLNATNVGPSAWTVGDDRRARLSLVCLLQNPSADGESASSISAQVIAPDGGLASFTSPGFTGYLTGEHLFVYTPIDVHAELDGLYEIVVTGAFESRESVPIVIHGGQYDPLGASPNGAKITAAFYARNADTVDGRLNVMGAVADGLVRPPPGYVTPFELVVLAQIAPDAQPHWVVIELFYPDQTTETIVASEVQFGEDSTIIGHLKAHINFEPRQIGRHTFLITLDDNPPVPVALEVVDTSE